MEKKFTVRVELHGAKEADYERLHEVMDNAGFRKALRFEEERFALPTAEYRYFSETETNDEVVTKAYNVAKQVKANPSVISTQGPVAHRGLKKLN